MQHQPNTCTGTGIDIIDICINSPTSSDFPLYWGQKLFAVFKGIILSLIIMFG